MRTIYQQDQIKLDAARITNYKHPVFGDITVFHDVVIASEIVQPYDDGRAWKPREELEKYTPYVDGRWVIVGAHPSDGIISDMDQVSGRTVNPRYVKDLLDPKTKRPCRAGVRADIEIFNNKVPLSTLEDMKNGKKQDVSIGFFFSKDEVAGMVEDGPFKGDEYDYVQRNMFHDHLAAGLDNGRCPMPFCGLGADELNKNLVGDPFSGFENLATCVTQMTKPKDEGGQGYTEEQAKKVCGMLKSKHEKKKKDADKMREATKLLIRTFMEEMEALKGEREATKTADKAEWWREIEWAEDDSRTVFDALPEETRNLIIEAGLCPECMDAARTEAERVMSHFKISPEDWEKLSDEEKKEYIEKLPKRKGEGDMTLEEINAKIAELQTRRKELKDKIDEYYKEQPTQSPTSNLWNEIEDVDKELTMLFNAKAFKLAIGDTVNDVDGYELDYVEADKQLTYTQKVAKPDEAYAYIEEGCKKVDGKTEQKCRHMPIDDEAHVKAALAALMGARQKKPPPYASKAKPKVCAAAKKFKIESEVCGTEKKKKDEAPTKLDPYEVMRRADKILNP